MGGKTVGKKAAENAQKIERAMRDFVRASPLNHMPHDAAQPIFGEPLVRYADANDVLFTQFKTIIASVHLTPREALALALGKKPDLSAALYVISWILPVALRTRKSNREEKARPSRLWAYTRWYGEQFNEALRKHIVEVLHDWGYLSTAPAIEPFFRQERNEKGFYSNWSERHVAYVAGHGTFSLSDGFITERGIAHRCGSVVTDMALPPSLRTANTAFSNCTFYVDGGCKACIARCPAGAITEAGHDKNRCYEYQRGEFAGMREELGVGNTGCGLCQTKVPCEFKIPATKR